MKTFIDTHWDTLLSKLFFTKIQARNWLKKENDNFGGSSPRILIEHGRSHKVLEFLRACTNGF